MPSSIMGRNYLYQCFTKIKSPLPQLPSPQLQLTSNDHHHHNRPSSLIRNYNSLYYDHNYENKESNSTLPDIGTTPDFATIYASQRFFFSSPGRSNSIIDSTSPSLSSISSSATGTNQESDQMVSTNSIAVDTYSPDPYVDFRHSMQEMVDARDLRDVRANWDCLHELLLCYLALNPKSTHKFIVRAFADLLATLMPPTSPERPGGSC